MSSLAVVQVVDSLQDGGLESVAVNLANLLGARGVRSYLCSTRTSGPLERLLSKGTEHVNLKRNGLMDVRAVLKFVRFLKDSHIDIIHAHGTSLFFSALAGHYDQVQFVHGGLHRCLGTRS